ncbi:MULTISPECIES: hypothetical protein [Clostridium]|jgi:hypothetical protein|uniref:hypothetical protein n=1 Tax=Clostridium TaxID=1485 RepID=UPI00242A57E4|nr:hypothetical protein [Clostridium tyrobutyricum]
MRYPRLYTRSKKCIDLYKKTNDVKYAMEGDCIDSLYECEGFEIYEKILKFAKDNNFKKIYDIGCAYGHQSEVFLNSAVDYVGIEACKFGYWNSDKYHYINQEYPFKINAADNELAVSVLCLTWNCYLYEEEKTLKEQCQALQRDFKHCLLYIVKDKINYMKKYYKNSKIIEKGLIYFSN